MFCNVRNKLLLPILAITVIGLTSITVINYNLSSKALGGAITENGYRSANSLSDLLDIIFGGLKTDSNTLSVLDYTMEALTPQEANSSTEDHLTKYIKKVMSNQPLYQTMGVLNANGNLVASNRGKGEENYKDTDFFKKIMDGADYYLSDPFPSKLVPGRNIVVGASAIKNGAKTIGVAFVSVDLTDMSSTYLDTVKVGESGYSFIIDNQKNFLAHTKVDRIMDPSLKTSEIARILIDERQNSSDPNVRQQGEVHTDYKGDNVVYFYYKNSVTNWYSVVRGSEADVYSPVITLRNVGIGISLATFVGIALVIFLVVRGLVSSLNKGVEYAKAVATGDLNQSLTVERNDEIGTLASSLRTMVAELKKMITTSDEKTKEAEEQTEKARVAMAQAEEARLAAESAKSEGMRQAGTQLSSIASHIVNASNTLVSHIKDSSKGASRQLQRTSEAATAMEEMNATVYEVARNASSAAESAEETKSNASEGFKVVENVVGAITEVETKAGILRGNLDSLGEQAQSIGQIMNVISDIADQTNLLALNAAIEAARAGEAGRGFAVVADEVRKLAEKTMSATKEVGDAVRAIQTGTATNIKDMEETSVAVQQTTELVTTAGTSLQSILSIAEATADKVRSIATASEEQSAASEEINRGTEEINDIAEETSSHMTASEQALDDLMGLIEDIKKLVAELENA